MTFLKRSSIMLKKLRISRFLNSNETNPNSLLEEKSLFFCIFNLVFILARKGIYMTSINSNKGFSLPSVLVALFVGGVVSLVLMDSSKNLLAMHNQVKEMELRSELLLSLEIIKKRIDNDTNFCNRIKNNKGEFEIVVKSKNKMLNLTKSAGRFTITGRNTPHGVKLVPVAYENNKNQTKFLTTKDFKGAKKYTWNEQGTAKFMEKNIPKHKDPLVCLGNGGGTNPGGALSDVSCPNSQFLRGIQGGKPICGTPPKGAPNPGGGVSNGLPSGARIPVPPPPNWKLSPYYSGGKRCGKGNGADQKCASKRGVWEYDKGEHIPPSCFCT